VRDSVCKVIGSEIVETVGFVKSLFAPTPTASQAHLNLEERYRRARAWASSNDVTRLAECTGFDRLGVPNFYAVRPSAVHPCAVVSSGKGLTRATAILSALFECFERWAAEQAVGKVFLASGQELLARFAQVLVAIPESFDLHKEIPWVVGFDLVSREPCFLPLKAVIFPYPSFFPSVPELSSNTSGLAAGIDPIETLCSALLEVLERDSVSRIDETQLELVDAMSIGGSAASLAQTFSENNIQLAVARCPGISGVPTFYCLTADDSLAVSSLFCSGSASHPDEEEALKRALLEVTQSRIAFISTLRDDVGPQVMHHSAIDYRSRKTSLEHWFVRDTLRSVIPRSASSLTSPRDCMTWLLATLQEISPQSILACARLRSAEGLLAFRIYSPSLNQLSRV
jgi:thioglycine synthase